MYYYKKIIINNFLFTLCVWIYLISCVIILKRRISRQKIPTLNKHKAEKRGKKEEIGGKGGYGESFLIHC